MKKGKAWYRPVGILLLLASAGVFWMSNHLPDRVWERVLTVACVLLMNGGVWLLGTDIRQRNMTAEEQRTQDLARHDERNIAIQEKAAQTAWNWTAGMLFAAALAALILDELTVLYLSMGAYLLHILFYILSTAYWRRKL